MDGRRSKKTPVKAPPSSHQDATSQEDSGTTKPRPQPQPPASEVIRREGSSFNPECDCGPSGNLSNQADPVETDGTMENTEAGPSAQSLNIVVRSGGGGGGGGGGGSSVGGTS